MAPSMDKLTNVKPDPQRMLQALQTIMSYEQQRQQAPVGNRAERRAAAKRAIPHKEYEKAVAFMANMNSKFNPPPDPEQDV